MHHGILSAGIENGGHWPGPTRRFWVNFDSELYEIRLIRTTLMDLGWNHQICTNMHHGILSAGIENGDHWPSRSFWPSWRRILENLVCRAIRCSGFELESTNLHQICILGFSQLVLKMGVNDIDLLGHLAISTQNSKKQHSASLSHTDLGRPRVLHVLDVLL